MARLDWARVARSFLEQLQERGITLDAVDDGEGFEPCLNSNSSKLAIRKEAAEALTAVDEAWLQVSFSEPFVPLSQQPHGKQTAIIFFVFGNSPEEIFADAQIKSGSPLEALIDSAQEEFARIWEGRPCPTLPEAA